MTRKSVIIFIALLVVHLGLLILFASLRVLDGDEGFYLNATRAVGLGKALYTDFFYTQLTLMPTVFAPLALDGWTSFWTLRGFTVAAGFLSAVLLFAIVLRATRDARSALIALFMYAVSGIILSWHSAYKPLAFSHFLTLGTFFFWLRYYQKQRLWYLVLTGLLLSAVINLRAVYIILLPLYLFSVWTVAGSARRIREMIVFCLSLIPFAIPTAAKIITSADRFFFNTFVFQLHRADHHGMGYIVSNKLLTLLKTVVDPQLFIIGILTIVSMRLLWREKRIRTARDLVSRPEGMVLMNLVLIAGIYLTPNPILRQYVEQFIAFGIILLAFNLAPLWDWLRAFTRPLQRRAILAVITGLYVLSLFPYLGIYIFGMRATDKMYLLSEVKTITSQMLALGEQSDTVLAEWTGYPFFTGQVSLPYTELLGFQYPLPLDHEGYMKYRLADYEYLRDEIIKKTPRLVITVNRVPPAYADVLNEGYEFAYESGGVTIHTRR
ncbi:MAG: glycosyltransferase family 39 protein [Candidatus Zixiibacteriota bacterium]|nr:MAG: glycosyltransferase family 39 protein [candidate division Zixibacteria bacterium]